MLAKYDAKPIEVSQMQAFDVIAFDGDDTLWQSEYLYVEAQARFKELLTPYLPSGGIEDARVIEQSSESFV